MTARVHIVREARADYAPLPPLVVDASVLATIVFGDAGAEEAVRQLARHRLVAPSLIDYEMANVARNKVRRKVLDASEADRALDAFAALRMERRHVVARDAFAMAERLGLTAYDAAYVQLALELGAPLATLDAGLAAAARDLMSGPRGVPGGQ